MHKQVAGLVGSSERKRWEFVCSRADSYVPKSSGFRFDPENLVWYAPSNEVAYGLHQYAVDPAHKQWLITRFAPRLVCGEGYWELKCAISDKDVAKNAGFLAKWERKGDERIFVGWRTTDPEIAMRLIRFASPEVSASITKAFEHKKESIEKSLSAYSDASFPKPEGLEDDYLPFQKAGIEFSLTKRNVLIGDDMGLGKTIQAIGIANCKKHDTILVICPSFLKKNWEREMRKWLILGDREISIISSGSGWKNSKIVIVNYDLVERYAEEIRSTQWDLFVLDEAHFCKNQKAVRTVYCFGGELRRKGREPVMISPIPARNRVYLTGTPILNRPVELWPILNSLDPDTWDNFFAFAKRYCGAYRSRYGWDFSGASNLEELQKKLRETILIRRRKADVLKELPSKRRQVVEIPANGDASLIAEELSAYEARRAVLEDLSAGVELARVSGNSQEYAKVVSLLKAGHSEAFEEISRIRAELGRKKIQHVVEYVRNILESGEKVLCFTHHIPVAEAIAEALSEYAPILVHSEVQRELRETADVRFQNGESPLFVGTIKSAGVGYTLTSASHVVFAEFSWVPADLTQAEDRAHRYGQVSPVLVHHLVWEGSLDSYIVNTVVRKQEIFEAAMDDTVGYDTEPVVVPRVKADLREVEFEVSKRNLDRIFTKDVCETILHAIQVIASFCDGAFSLDNAGFNRFDARIGKDLASRSVLTPKQASLALKIVYKYRRQLSYSVLSDIETIYDAVRR